MTQRLSQMQLMQMLQQPSSAGVPTTAVTCCLVQSQACHSKSAVTVKGFRQTKPHLLRPVLQLAWGLMSMLC
jgi:hypothetical protein